MTNAVSTDVQHSEALMLVHGAGGASHEMRFIAAVMRRHMNCLGMTLLGHGKRPIPDGYTMDEIADDLASSIRPADKKKPFIFGFCMGATATLNMLTRHHGLVQGAILLANRYRYDENAVNHRLHIISEERLARTETGLANAYQAAHGDAWPEVVKNNRRLYSNYLEQSPVDENRLAGIDCPVLIIGPNADPLTTPAEATDLARAIPRSRLMMINGSAHPLRQVPHKLIEFEVLRFCDDVRRGTI